LPVCHHTITDDHKPDESFSFQRKHPIGEQNSPSTQPLETDDPNPSQARESCYRAGALILTSSIVLLAGEIYVRTSRKDVSLMAATGREVGVKAMANE